ncbi:MAG: hypothetical protein U1A27_04150 [Phycisphaerae bacterium]
MYTPLLRRAVVLALVAGWLAVGSGCGGTGAGLPDGGGSSTSLPPGAQFVNPAGNAVVRDDSVLVVRYSVLSSRPVVAHLTIDRDGIADTGDEFAIAPDETIPAPGGERQAEFVAGRFPYGPYVVRVTLSDDQGSYSYKAPGLVTVVPLVNNTADSTNDLTAALPQVEGLRLLYTAGSPGPINTHIPFVATWSYPDFLDHLSPVFVQPFELNQAVAVHRLSFYTFGHAGAEPKRIVLYRGTSDTALGDEIGTWEFDEPSYRTGGWNLVHIDPPITLEPGRYGVSYHGVYEFSENWAGNTPKGTGYVWVSPFIDTAFNKVTAADLGFEPNFTLRILGRLVPEASVPTPNVRLIIPAPLDPVFPDNGSKPPQGLAGKTDDVDVLGGASPFHITWQQAQ